MSEHYTYTFILSYNQIQAEWQKFNYTLRINLFIYLFFVIHSKLILQIGFNSFVEIELSSDMQIIYADK